MVSRALVVALLLPLAISVVSAQTFEIVSRSDNANRLAASLSGKVLNADGRPAGGVRVELNDPNTAVPVSSAYTQPDGSFELYNIPQGSYEVVAESGDTEVSDAVAVDSSRPPLELRFPRASAAQYGDGATVSVAQMLVPDQARKYYRRGLDAYRHGHDDEAQSNIEQALLIAPEYADALTLRGMIEMQRHDLQAAQGYLEHAIRIDSSSAAAYVALGAVYNHEGRYDDALQASERSTSLSPRTWQGYFEMAKAAVGKGMYQKALLLARQAERFGGGGFSSLHLVKACALYPLKLYKDAREEVQTVLLHEPKSPSAQQAQSLLAEINAASGPKTIAGAH